VVFKEAKPAKKQELKAVTMTKNITDSWKFWCTRMIQMEQANHPQDSKFPSSMMFMRYIRCF
jgi:hypothetical protein